MAARSVWAGAVMVGGFPIPLKVYTLKPKGAESFKSLCPCHEQPITQHKHCAVTDEVIAHEDLLKGIPVGSGKNAGVVTIDDDDLEALRELTAQRTLAADILQLPPVDTVPWHLATGRYRIVPDDKAIGSDKSVSILWNGLLATDRALITQWIKRKGSKPALAAIRADMDGLTASELPYADAVRDDDPDVPTFDFQVDEQAQQMFSMFVDAQQIDTGPFVHEAFVDTVGELRAELAQAALAGTPIPAREQAEEAPAAVPDLMALMAASLANVQAGGTPTPAAKAPAAKPAKAAAKPAPAKQREKVGASSWMDD